MTILLLKTRDGQVHRAQAVMHCLMAEKLGVSVEDIVAVGIMNQGREVWDERKPD